MLGTRLLCVLVCVLLGFQCCCGLPVDRAQVKEKAPAQLDLQDYMSYWEEMARNDPDLMERLKKVKDMDMSKLQEMIARNPHLQERIVESRGDYRNQVEEARRITVEQMRQLQKLQTMRNNNLLKDGDWMTKKEALRDNLPAHFNDGDIRAKLQEAKRKLEGLDQKRKEDFKHEELWKEHRRRQKLKEMNEQQRLKAEEEFRKKHEQLRQHEKLPKPASKEQLEQVWEEDGMNREQFSPRTFFHMHDTNADLTLDPLELEALFYSELKKVYKEDIDGLEANEDMARMREYALEQIDQDKDGLVSLDEFMKFTAGQPGFDTKEEWHPIVDEDVPFSDKELAEYEEDYEEDYDYQYDSDGNIIGIVPRSPQGSKVPPQGQQPPQGLPPQDQPPQGLPPQGQQPPQDLPPQGEERRGDPDVPVGVQVDDPSAINMQPIPIQEEHERRMAPPPSNRDPNSV